ncbi:mercury resistance system periplasmic binding protein MerP [Paraglaciecola sp. Hal342]
MTYTSLEKMMKKIALLSLLALTSLTAFAAENSYFGSPNHELCDLPIYGQKGLTKVEGVSKAEVTFETKLAVVTFDDEKTTVKALTEATTNAGYPSTLKE